MGKLGNEITPLSTIKKEGRKESKMIPYKYIVILTNGTTEQTYRITASSERAAVILAQAEAIKLARGYDIVSVSQEYKTYCYSF